MMDAGLLLVATLAVPLAMATACLSPWLRAQMLGWLPLAPLPGLITAFFAKGDSIVVAPPPLRLTLALDDVGAMLLGGASLLWGAAGLYASVSMRGEQGAAGFAVWWLLTLAGSLGVFIVADMTSFYLAFSLASLAAYGLVAYEGTARAQRASVVYMALALVGEALILLGLVMLVTAAPGGNPLIRDAVAMLPGSPLERPALVLLVLGFGLKMGLVPLHVWMPLAHPVAPIPASAALSGIIVKAGVIGLIRFLPLGEANLEVGQVLVLLGLLTAFYGVIVGLTQRHPKTILAYSTVSQMGFVAAVLGAGLAGGETNTAILAAFYALHHLLVKGALFLGVGIVGSTGTKYLCRVLVPMGLLALSLAGLPFSSGALAKLATKPLFGDGMAAAAAAAAAVGSALLMFHFVNCLRAKAHESHEMAPEPPLLLSWVIVGVASLLVPWALFGNVTPYTLPDAVTAGALWGAAWPIALGALLAFLLKGSQDRFPAIPEGDIVVFYEKLGRLGASIGTVIAQAEQSVRRWPEAVLGLLTLAILLSAALQFAR
jgi:formate hydrogenlyase subunit 3/multisubunit Na+/H+ antiporter MnhD subunit